MTHCGHHAEPIVVIAHRGASGYRPEHTLSAYRLAIRQCADYIEPDLVSTKDGVLVDRHENEIGGTTDVSARSEFADRQTTKTVDGRQITGWFTEDFTLAELRTLRATERLPDMRPQNTAYDGRYRVPTFTEVLELARSSRTCSGKRVGVIPEIKHSTYFRSIGLPMERKAVAALTAFGYGKRSSPSAIQSFEVNSLKRLNRMTTIKLVQLVDSVGAPADQVAAKTGITYRHLVTRRGLQAIARYADQVAFCKELMIPRNADATLGRPTSVIRDAHRAGLTVVGWTLRAENHFLSTEFRSSTNPAQWGDMAGEIRVFLRAGMDHLFTDQPDLAVAAVQGYRRR